MPGADAPYDNFESVPSRGRFCVRSGESGNIGARAESTKNAKKNANSPEISLLFIDFDRCLIATQELSDGMSEPCPSPELASQPEGSISSPSIPWAEAAHTRALLHAKGFAAETELWKQRSREAVRPSYNSSSCTILSSFVRLRMWRTSSCTLRHHRCATACIDLVPYAV